MVEVEIGDEIGNYTSVLDSGGALNVVCVSPNKGQYSYYGEINCCGGIISTQWNKRVRAYATCERLHSELNIFGNDEYFNESRKDRPDNNDYNSRNCMGEASPLGHNKSWDGNVKKFYLIRSSEVHC